MWNLMEDDTDALTGNIKPVLIEVAPEILEKK